MTAVCEQLSRPDWLDEDTTTLGLASDASVIGAAWLAAQWRFSRPDEGTEFSCPPSSSGLYRFTRTLRPPITAGGRTTWEPALMEGIYSTLPAQTSLVPWARTVVIAGSPGLTGLTTYIPPYPGTVIYAPSSPAAFVSVPLEEVPTAVAVHAQKTAEIPGSRLAPQLSPLDIIIDLKDSLDLTWDDAERATGIDRNTFLNWQRTGAVPRPSTVRKLMRVHGLVASLRSALSDARATAWLREGEPKPIDVLKTGGLKAFTAAVTAVIDGEERRRAAEFGHRPGPEEEEEAPLPPRMEFRSSDRRATRSHLPEDHD